MKTKLACIIALILTLNISAFADDNSFAHLYPENTGLFMEFNNTSTTNSEFGNTAFSQMVNDPQTQKFVSQVKSKLDEVFTLGAIMTQGIKPDILLSAFGHHVSLGFFTNGASSELLLIAEFPEDIDPVKTFATMNPAGVNAKEFSLTLPINPEIPTQMLFLKITGQRLYASIGTSIDALDSAINTRITSLASSTDYLRASSQIGANRLITMYLDPSLYDVFSVAAKQFGVEEALTELDKDDFNTTAFGMNIEPPAFVNRTYTKEPTTKYPYTLLSTPDVSQLSFVTTDATSFSTLGADLDQVISAFKNLVETAIQNNSEVNALTPDEKAEFLVSMQTTQDEMLKEVRETIGVDPLKDIAGKLGSQFTSCIQNTDRLPGLSLFGFGGSTFIANAKNPTDLGASLDKIIETVIPKLEDQVATKLQIETEFGTIKGIALANAVTVCYIIIDNTVIFSLNPAAIEYTLAQRKAKQNLLSSKAFGGLKDIISATASKTGISTEPVGVTGFKIDGISDLLNNTVALGASIGGIAYATEEAGKVRAAYNGSLPFSPIPSPEMNPPAFVKYVSELLPIYLLPSKDTINKYVFDGWAASFITQENEFVNISYGPFPVDNILFSKVFSNIVEFSKYAAVAAVALQQDLLEDPLH